MPPRLVSQDVPHRLRGGTEEMRPIDVTAVGADELYIRLMKQGGGVECGRAVLTTALPVRELVEFVVKQGQQRIHRLGVAFSGCLQQNGHILASWKHHFAGPTLGGTWNRVTMKIYRKPSIDKRIGSLVRSFMALKLVQSSPDPSASLATASATRIRSYQNPIPACFR